MAGAASMAGVWFIHWPVRGLYRPSRVRVSFVLGLDFVVRILESMTDPGRW